MDSLNLVNSGKPYFIRLDIAKESGKLARFSDWLKTRVNDNGKKVPIKWYDQGQEMNVHGFYPYMQGGVGHFTTDENNNPVPSSDVVYREWQGTPDDVTDSGIVYYTLEDQFFSSQGEFVGTFGLRDTAGNNYTGVNVIFEVLGNDFRIAQTKKYYITELDNLKIQYEDATKQFMNNAKAQADQALAQTRADVEKGVQPIKDSLNLLDGEIKLNRANEENLEQQLNYNQQLIDNQNIVTRPEHQQDIDNLSSAINQRLSQFKTAPVAVENADVLKSKYPNGADGIYITADTGHKWIYLDGQWKDCGEYQAIGISNEITDPMKDQLAKQQVQINQNTNDIGLNSLGIKKNSVDIQNIEGAGHLMDILLVDDAGNYITDDYGNRIGGYKWLPLTDVTLTQAGLPADGLAVGNAILNATDAHAERYGLPVLYLYDTIKGNILSLQDKSKTLKNEVKYKFPLFGIQGTLAKLKVQGASSAGYPEKNYTLTFDQDFAAFKDYGRQNKYVIKANWTDFSQSKNVVCAQMWSSVRHLNDEKNISSIVDNEGNYLSDSSGNHIVGITDPQLAIQGAGAIDGFPIAVYINNQFWGLYTFNIPKDAWMAKMPEKANYAIVSADTFSPQTEFKALTNLDDGLSLEFCGTDDSTWVKNSLNKLIGVAMEDYDTASAFDSKISSVLDIQSAIDYIVYILLIDGVDNVNKNYLLQTYDGEKWYFAVYDMDETLGWAWENQLLRPDSEDLNVTLENITNGDNRLYYQIFKFHKQEILQELKNLVDGIMSPENVRLDFAYFVRNINAALYNEDAKKWGNKPNTSIINYQYIVDWYSRRINWIKNKYLNLTD